MPNKNSFQRQDLYAVRDAVVGAALAVAAAAALSLPTTLVAAAGVVGTVLGQLFARWRRKRNPDERHEEVLSAKSMLRFSLWALGCIGIGAGLAYMDGYPIGVLAKMVGSMAVLVAFAIASTMVAKRLAAPEGGNTQDKG